MGVIYIKIALSFPSLPCVVFFFLVYVLCVLLFICTLSLFLPFFFFFRFLCFWLVGVVVLVV